MSIQSTIVGQFHHPSGPLGSLAGWIMARRGSNLERNRWTLSLLGIAEGDRVLELGFGPGVAVGLAAVAAGPKGQVVGVDHSSVMLAQAERRNRALIDQRRVELRLGNLDGLDQLKGPFDKVFSSNVLQFQKDKTSILTSVLFMMRPGGRLATTFQPRLPGATLRNAQAFADDLAQSLGEIGFVNLRSYSLPVKPAPAICVVAETPTKDYALDA